MGREEGGPARFIHLYGVPLYLLYRHGKGVWHTLYVMARVALESSDTGRGWELRASGAGRVAYWGLGRRRGVRWVWGDGRQSGADESGERPRRARGAVSWERAHKQGASDIPFTSRVTTDID